MNVIPRTFFRRDGQQHGCPFFVRALVALIIVASGLGSMSGPAAAAAPTAFYVEQTGHTFGGEFLQWWIEHDGRTTLGNPVTEPILTTDDTTQYFEFGVLVQSHGAEVVREQAASTLLAIRSDPTHVQPRELSAPSNSSVITVIEPIRSLSALGSGFVFHVDERVRPFYESQGGRSFFGRPITPAEINGSVSEQWFEYARIEVRASSPALGTVGFELAVALGISTSPTSRGDLPAFNPDRYVKFAGDGTIPNADIVFTPSRIMIPAIDVDAAIESVAVTNNVMQVPLDEWKVGWYPSMSSPGEWSNVVMAGHKDWWGVGPVVFWNLDKLRSGDKIYVVGPDGSGATYEVTLSWMIDASTPADGLIADTGFEALTLITCGGQWNGSEYTSRRIIRAKRI